MTTFFVLMILHVVVGLLCAYALDSGEEDFGPHDWIVVTAFWPLAIVTTVGVALYAEFLRLTGRVK